MTQDNSTVATVSISKPALDLGIIGELLEIAFQRLHGLRPLAQPGQRLAPGGRGALLVLALAGQAAELGDAAAAVPNAL